MKLIHDLQGKNHNELALLETEIMKKVRMQQEGVDVAYWESLLGHLKAHMAKARLRERHQETLRKKLSKLKSEQLAEVNRVVASLTQSTSAAPFLPITSPIAAVIAEDEEERDKQWMYDFHFNLCAYCATIIRIFRTVNHKRAPSKSRICCIEYH
jgi:hypothetical protein